MVKTLNRVQSLTEAQQARSMIVVAASGEQMADGLFQDPLRAQVRLRNGDLVYVKDLPPIDPLNRQPNGDYIVPLVADHSGHVRDQIGGAWLYIYDNHLYALIVFSDTATANDVKAIADDGFLQFSTEGYVSEISGDGVYGDFWVSTLSPVTVGNDPGTQVVENMLRFVNAAPVKGEKLMSEDIKEDAGVDVEALKEQIKAELQAETQTPEPKEEIVEEKKEEEKVENKVTSTPKPPKPAVPVQHYVEVKNDMTGDAALKAFSNALAVATRDRKGLAGVEEAMRVWKTQNAISGDAILPESIASTFFKAWLDNENLSAFRFMNAKAGAVYALGTSDTAKGHAKGDEKTGQTLSNTRRDLKALAVYKKLEIDQQDLFDDHSGQLVRFRAEELSARITNQILVAALLGGAQEGSVGSTSGNGTRGLFGIVPDAQANSGFGNLVASEVEGTEDEDAYSAVVRTIGSIVATGAGNVQSAGRSGSGITLFVPWAAGGNSWVTQLLLTTNEQGNYIFANGNIEQLLRISRIVEVPELAITNQIVAVADGAYQLYGENSPKMYPYFDTQYNVNQLLGEQYVAGSLAGYKQAAVYTPANAS